MSDVTKIQNPSITPKDFTIQDNKIIAISGIPVSGAGGTTSDYVYYPSYDDTTGDIIFTLGTTQGQPGPFGPYHISGAQGEQKRGAEPPQRGPQHRGRFGGTPLQQYRHRHRCRCRWHAHSSAAAHLLS